MIWLRNNKDTAFRKCGRGGGRKQAPTIALLTAVCNIILQYYCS